MKTSIHTTASINNSASKEMTMKYIKTILNLSEEVLAEIIANPQASEKVAQMGKHGKNREQFVLEVRQYMVQRCTDTGATQEALLSCMTEQTVTDNSEKKGEVMKNNLQSGEEVINKSKIHWVIFLNPFFILSLIMIATSNISPFGFHYLFLVLLRWSYEL